MFKDIDNTLKNIGFFLFFLSVIGGLAWIISNLIHNHNIVYPIVSMGGGCVTSLLIYAFGVLLTLADDINVKLSERK